MYLVETLKLSWLMWQPFLSDFMDLVLVSNFYLIISCYVFNLHGNMKLSCIIPFFSKVIFCVALQINI